MANGEEYNKISGYAVRIAKNSHSDLLGTGVLFLRHSGESPLLLTAAHVVASLTESEEPGVLCLGFRDGEGNIQTLELKVCCGEKKYEIGEIYIHPQYKEIEGKQNQYFYDAAIVILPWKEWMKTKDSFALKDGIDGEELKGWGFPESMDGEQGREAASILAGKKKIDGSVDALDKEVKRFSFSYHLDTVGRNITRESIMRGFSGSGLFGMENGGAVLKGLVSCECGDDSAGKELWASSSGLFLELMDYFGIKICCPLSFEPYKQMAIACFTTTRKKAKQLFLEWSEELIEEHGLLPEKFEDDTQINLGCNSNRKFCDDFWTAQLKKAVILYGINEVSAGELAHPILELPDSHGTECVQMDFLCTEEYGESVIGGLIEKDYFARDRKVKNGIILVLNGKSNQNSHILYPRSECREIICNITDGYEYSPKKLKRKINNLLTDPLSMENSDEGDFDIIKGIISQCDIAAVGLERMVEILNRMDVKRESMKEQMKELLKEIWKV